MMEGFKSKVSGFLGGMASGMRDRFESFQNRMTNPNIGRQEFGSSPLQQAMAQQRMGNMTPQAEEMMNYYMQNNPEEMHRQAKLMESGRHGDYGIDRKANPYFTDATTNLVQTGPPENIGSSPVEMSTSVAEGDTKAVDQRLMLDRFMQDPSKLNSEGVKSMQTMLNSLGFKDKNGKMLKVDGKMGPLTASAMDAYRGQLGQGAQESSEPLPDEPVVSGVLRADEYGQGYRADGVSPIEDEMAMAQEDVNKYGGRGGMNYGYQNIQNTIGNPANDSVMWGVDELSRMTNPLQFDFERGVPYRLDEEY